MGAGTSKGEMGKVVVMSIIVVVVVMVIIGIVVRIITPPPIPTIPTPIPLTHTEFRIQGQFVQILGIFQGVDHFQLVF